MKKLKEEELLRALDDMFHGHPISESINEKQAYRQIKEMLRDYNLIKDTCKMLVLKLEEKKLRVDQAFVNTWALEFATATLANKIMHRRIAYMLKEAGVKVVKK